MRFHVVVPERFDNPGQPTGGNIDDRRVCAGLAETGWEVLVATVATAWPVPGSGPRADLARIFSAIPDGETVLIDGLIGSPAAAQLLPHTGRLPMTVLRRAPPAPATGRRTTAAIDLRGWEQTTQEIANALTAHERSKPVPPGMNNHPGESAR